MVNILDGCQYFVQRKRRPIIRDVQVKISYIKLLSLASVFDGVYALYYGDLCAVLPWRLVLPQGFFFLPDALGASRSSRTAIKYFWAAGVESKAGLL